MRIILVLASLRGGGAERAAVLLAEGFLRQEHQVSVVTLDGKETDFYQLPCQVNRLVLDVAGNSPNLIYAIKNNLYRSLILRKAICSFHPDIVISFLEQTNILTLLSLINTKYEVLVSEQNNPDKLVARSLWKKLRRITYPLAARVVSTSKGVDDYFDWLPQTKRVVIYNPLTSAVEDKQSLINLPQGANPEKNWVIAMGRLTYQKGFDILLSAFQKIYHHFANWQLIVLGEGELRPELEKLRENLGLDNQVIFPGLINNPFPLLKRSKLFVLSSRFEGFGNVLIEAMACGLPVISTDCPSGPREIISDGVDGILVPNENISALAAAMEHLMSDEKEINRLATCALESVQKFRLEKIVDRWEALISQVIQERTK